MRPFGDMKCPLVPAGLIVLTMAFPAMGQMTIGISNTLSAATNARPGSSTAVMNRASVYQINGEDSLVTFSLFPGEFTSPLDGELVLAIGDPTVSAPSADMLGVAVKRAVFLGTDWTPDNNFLPEPQVLFLDPRRRSVGWLQPTGGAVRIVLYLTGSCGGPPVPMPLTLTGFVGDASIHLTGDNGPVADALMTVDLHAFQVINRPEIRFSTEMGIPIQDPSGTYSETSDGDLLGEHHCVLLSNQALTANLGIMPVAPDVGLDALAFTGYRPIMFSIEVPVWSETLGQLGHGDLLSSTGKIVRRNAQLIAAFGPAAAVADVGLDAVHIPTAPYVNATSANCCAGLFFSVEQRFFSGALNRWIGHGDLLTTCGRIFRTNRQLLANFDPIAVPCLDDDCVNAACDANDEPNPADLVPCNSTDSNDLCRDFGLDGVYFTDGGEIWFSTECGFLDGNLGWISSGDVLSDRGRVIRRNLRLVDACDPLIDIDNFGLDALDFVNPTPLPMSNTGDATSFDGQD